MCEPFYPQAVLENDLFLWLPETILNLGAHIMIYLDCLTRLMFVNPVPWYNPGATMTTEALHHVCLQLAPPDTSQCKIKRIL